MSMVAMVMGGTMVAMVMGGTMVAMVMVILSEHVGRKWGSKS